MAKDIVDRLARGQTPMSALRLALDRVRRRIAIVNEIAVGALVLAHDGRFAIRHTSRHMLAGHWTGKGEPTIADRFREALST
jgi:isoaspartyl peptidase/L-asparaginase-like protein (Ntn-hydrolase superfamily)